MFAMFHNVFNNTLTLEKLENYEIVFFGKYMLL